MCLSIIAFEKDVLNFSKQCCGSWSRFPFGLQCFCVRSSFVLSGMAIRLLNTLGNVAKKASSSSGALAIAKQLFKQLCDLSADEQVIQSIVTAMHEVHHENLIDGQRPRPTRVHLRRNFWSNIFTVRSFGFRDFWWTPQNDLNAISFGFKRSFCVRTWIFHS